MRTPASIKATTSRAIPTTTPMPIAVAPSRVAGAAGGMVDGRTVATGTTDVLLGCGAVREKYRITIKPWIP